MKRAIRLVFCFILIVAFFPFSLLIAICLIIFRKRKQHKSNSESELLSEYSKITNGYDFEHFCAKLLRINGFSNVSVTQSSGDYGIDVLANKNGLKYAIQCKHYSSTVGNSAIQEAATGKLYYECDVAVVMTNSTFTANAINLAKSAKVLLWDGDSILALIKSSDLHTNSLRKKTPILDSKLISQAMDIAFSSGYITETLLVRKLSITHSKASELIVSLLNLGIIKDDSSNVYTLAQSKYQFSTGAYSTLEGNDSDPSH